MNKENHFIQAFNNGYTLAKREPELLETVTKNLSPTNDYLEGLFEGKHEYQKEQAREISMNELEGLRNNSYEKQNGLERE